MTATNGDLDVTATSSQTVSAKSVAVAASIAIPKDLTFPISIALSGSGATSTNTVTNIITAAIDGGASIDVTGAASITAKEAPDVDADATGAAVSLGLIGIAIAGVFSNSSIYPTIASYVGDSTDIAAGSLTILASQTQDTSNDLTANASASGGSGGILAGAVGGSSTAAISGSVMAYTGNSMTLPNGDVSIEANNLTSQSANANGGASGS